MTPHKWRWLITLIPIWAIFTCIPFVIAQSGRDITWVDWKPDGTVIALGYDDGSLEIWDANATRIITTFQLPGSIHGFKWNSLDDRLVGVSTNENFEGVIWTLDTLTGERIDGLSGEFVVGDFDWNPTGDMVVSTDFIGMGSQNLVHLWDATLEQFHTFQALDHYEFYSADWHPTEQRWIALAEADGTLAIWDTQENVVLSITSVSEMEEYDLLQDISWNPNGDRLATVTYTENVEIWSWNGEILDSIIEFPHEPNIFGAAQIIWSPDGNYLAIVEGSLVRILDAETGSQIAATPPLTFLYSAAWSPDSRAIVYAGRGNDIGSSIWEIFDLDLASNEAATPQP
jgi:WD40 repeat protein